MNEEAQAVLRGCGLKKTSLEDLIAACEEQALYDVASLRDVTDAQWKELGVETIGDLISIKRALRPAGRGLYMCFTLSIHHLSSLL